MPQMSPLNWMSLYILFIFVFLIFNIINYFLFLYSPNQNKNFKKKILFNWKW
uniref:ATP synthase complex subunit 8 n=1 Tax=Sphenophorus sp. BYU-CO246 TaxID=696090 RepID=D8WKL4_9CUCU|nr:ATP synthase F0 subunit 8 [Sphenophorus sp. BYU-CO246]ACZ58547.1 ATP synthase F0 subunit 8 [Sphenophorus sp. BYU-CO246]